MATSVGKRLVKSIALHAVGSATVLAAGLGVTRAAIALGADVSPSMAAMGILGATAASLTWGIGSVTGRAMAGQGTVPADEFSVDAGHVRVRRGRLRQTLKGVGAGAALSAATTAGAAVMGLFATAGGAEASGSPSTTAIAIGLIAATTGFAGAGYGHRSGLEQNTRDAYGRSDRSR